MVKRIGGIVAEGVGQIEGVEIELSRQKIGAFSVGRFEPAAAAFDVIQPLHVQRFAQLPPFGHAAVAAGVEIEGYFLHAASEIAYFGHAHSDLCYVQTRVFII